MLLSVCGQCMSLIVDQTHLVQASGKLVLQKKASSPVALAESGIVFIRGLRDRFPAKEVRLIAAGKFQWRKYLKI